LTALAAVGFISLLVATPQRAQAEDATSGVIEILTDHAKIHRLPRAASTIILGNPLMADVSVEGGKLLVITGKNYGTTNLIALDSDGKVIGHFNLHVKTSGIHKVTLQRGVGRVSYACAPRCEPELQVGDDTKHFEALSKSIGTKSGLAKGTSQSTSSD
jgi:Flp pilus assembly secretin CpaC